MTKLTKPVTRTDGAFVIRMDPAGLMLRRPRTRTWFGPLPYSWLELQAAKLMADALRAERKAKRKGGRR